MSQKSVAPELPGFTYLGFIGGGGFADVFRYQDSLGRSVAIKVSHTVSTETAQAIAAEANLMAMLSNHPNIVSIYQAGVAPDGRTFLVMEMCSDQHLGRRIARRTLGASKAMDVTIRLVGAVETAHRLGILHRDIKPANILFTGYGTPALTDFGISATTDGGTANAALSPLWAPPEQHPDSRVAMGPWSDVFSLAATTWAMLVGHSPIELPGGQNDRLSIRQRMRTFSPPPTRRVDVPEALERVLATALAADPTQRYQSALEFGRALQGVQGQLNEQVTAIDVFSTEPEEPEDVTELAQTGTVIQSYIQIDPDQVDGNLTIDATRPTSGVTRPLDHSGPDNAAVQVPPSVIQHGRGFSSAGLRDFTSPAVPQVAPSVPTLSPTLPGVEQPTRRRNVGAIVAGVVALAAIAGAGMLWAGGAFGGAGTVVSPEPTAAVAQDPVVARVPPVENVVGVLDGESVTFTWSTPDAQDGDTYLVEEVSREDSSGLTPVSEPEITVAKQPGQTCVEVTTRRANGTAATTAVKGCVAS